MKASKRRVGVALRDVVNDGSAVGLGDLSDLFQPLWFLEGHVELRKGSGSFQLWDVKILSAMSASTAVFLLLFLISFWPTDKITATLLTPKQEASTCFAVLCPCFSLSCMTGNFCFYHLTSEITFFFTISSLCHSLLSLSAHFHCCSWGVRSSFPHVFLLSGGTDCCLSCAQGKENFHHIYGKEFFPPLIYQNVFLEYCSLLLVYLSISFDWPIFRGVQHIV